MLKIFLAEDEVIVRETIKRMIPWEEIGFELVGDGTSIIDQAETGSSDYRYKNAVYGWIDACKAGKERTSRTLKLLFLADMMILIMQNRQSTSELRIIF